MLRFLAACSLVFMFAPAQAQPTVPAPIRDELKRLELPADALSFAIEPLGGDAGRPSWSYYPNRMVNTASEMKLLTTMVALDELGPNFRWTTSIVSDAKLANAELKGNLYLRGGGEPNLTWERLGSMLRELRNQGIVTISGDLVLDRTWFQPARADLQAAPFDDTPDAPYNVIPDAMLVSDNLIAYGLSSESGALLVQATPPMSGVTFENAMSLDDRPCAQWKEGWRPPVVQASGAEIRITLGGSFPRNCKAAVELNTLERNLYIERVVAALWKEMGGVWHVQVREGATPPQARVLVERRFETLAETVRMVNKNSDAVRARLVYLTLGATARSEADQAPTLELARRRVLAWLAAHGIDSAGIVIENGAGLSRIERLSPAQLAALLKAASGSRWYAEFASSFPIVGLDGTMRNRMKGTPVASNARLKTGTLRDVAALAGYVSDSRGQNWIVAGIVNDLQTEKGRALLDKLLVWLADGALSDIK